MRETARGEMGGRGDRSAAEHVVVEDVEEVVELQGHLQSLSQVTPTSSETSKRQSTYRPRTGMRARISGGVGRRRGMRARLSCGVGRKRGMERG